VVKLYSVTVYFVLEVDCDETVQCGIVFMLQNVAETGCNEAVQSDIAIMLQNVTEESQV